MKPFNFFTPGCYRLFSAWWWKDVTWRLCIAWWRHDIPTFWHRGRYGWAPRDTWSLDYYLANVLAGSLDYLAETCNGTPMGYPLSGQALEDKLKSIRDVNDLDTDDEAWRRDLKHHAQVFRDYYDESYWGSDEFTPDQCGEIQRARGERAQESIAWVSEWFQALWS